ncbi:hypothetical protein SAMN05428984_2612 [Sphingomonas sp. OK281]|nr:hypothetical protein SAMN05428984_2612 [Sphingomonas sp. OK281]
MLWSATCDLKHRIGETYYGYHYTWCSPVFEAAAAPQFALGAKQPPSSDPVTIYRQLHAAVKGKDRHDPKIAGYRKSLRAIALKMRDEGKLSAEYAAEIVTRVRSAEFVDWKPLMYVIPYSVVAPRVQLVRLRDRASDEPEYVIPDLKREEFHIIELMPCL